MGINSASDDPECVCEAMLQFEREQGSLETFEAAMEKCSAQLKRVRERREIVSYDNNICTVPQLLSTTCMTCGLSNQPFT